MSTESEIGIIAAVDGDAATARWRVSQPSSEAQVLPPLQVQSLPGNQVNSLFALALGPDGAWHIDDRVVYYAPYQTGVFAPILTLPVDRSEYIVRMAVPGHLVIHHIGTRWVSIISRQYGLILDQELPALPTGSDPDTSMAGVVYEGDSADRIAIMFQSLDGDLRGYSYTTMESPGALFGVMPRVDVLAYPSPEYMWKPHALIGLADHAYQIPDIRGFFAGGTAGRASPAGIYAYEFTAPAPEVNPGLGVQDYAVTASPVSTLTWGPSGASATLYMDTVVQGSGYKWDSFPVPVTVGSTLTIRIEPVLLGTTHGTINIGGVTYPLRASNDDFFNRTTFYSDRIRLNDMLLAAGGTYPVSLSIFTSSSGSRTTPITLVSGGDPVRSGFRAGEFGSVSTTNVFQEGGVVRSLVRLESYRVHIASEPWSGGLVWLRPPSRPPFWTGFVHTVEDIDAGTTPDPVPDPDPDPDPSDGIAIVLLAGAHAEAPGIGYFPMLEMGGVDSDTLQVGGQTGTLTLLVYDYESGELIMAVVDLIGITSITLRIAGGEAITLSTTPDNTLWTAGLAESPFVDGQSYLIDLHIEAEEQPGEQYADFELVAGTTSSGWNAVGFVAGEAGTLQPENPVIGGISGYVYAIAYDVGAGSLTVEVDDIFGASGATLTVVGVGDFVLEVEASEYGFWGSLSMPGSPFVVGETYSVRLYLEGDLRDTE